MNTEHKIKEKSFKKRQILEMFLDGVSIEEISKIKGIEIEKIKEVIKKDINKKMIKDADYIEVKAKFKATIIDIYRKNGFMESYSLIKENTI